MKLLDRYVLRNFLEPFLICFFGFLSIWLLFDLMDNLSEFTSAHASPKVIAFYYLTQLPQIILISLPVGLLLALLFSLSSMSRRNEIISMLTAGISVPRLMLPLIMAGAAPPGLLLLPDYQPPPPPGAGEDEFRVLRDWSETPWRIGSAHQEAQNLTVPELRSYLVYNADFPAAQLAPFRTYAQYRLAVPLQCLVVIFMAGPLAIVFSRRGVVGGVAGAMFLYAALLLSTYFFLALGKGFRISPLVAAWGPNTFFFVICAMLLYFRGSNRELP